MGLLTELLIGTEDDAKAYADSRGTRLPAAVGRVALGDLTSLEFETLWAILENKAWDARMHALREVWHGADSFLFAFPARYVSTLTTLEPSSVASASVAWSATDEMRATPQEVVPIIEQMVLLARAVASSDNQLFLWFSL
jgi:hypothetical protein